jgi:tetratricopeptide (TPR) repeat protein/tRNA A-37 threonylcarbamoyl transferase component Bud32
MHSLKLLRDLFETAVGLPASERTAFLDGRCADLALRKQVEKLLVADASPDALLSGNASAAALAIGDADSAEALPPGSRIGPFELVAVLGEGGSSTVFRALRESEGVQQSVALKVLRRGLYSRDAQRQFRRERLVLAQLQHPGIARLIEGGVTDDGLAYIALDLVDGKPITDYAREHRLDMRQRLSLFLQVCRAVEAAHRALIVHRDLKPSNVLVNDDGQVKLLDFGIAKLLDSNDETQTRLPAFTPAYAAPEQRDGGLITTATDVYALGILLGELITGQRLSGQTGRAPSSQVTGNEAPGVLPAPPQITRRSLRGDLDNIVLKAIAAEPERRYSSAGSMADDVERMLDGRPVAAHPPSRWYRTRKFIQRHRGGVMATALFLLALLTAFGIAIWQANVARNEAARANTVRDFLVSVFDSARAHLPREQRPTPEALVEQAQRQLAASANLDAATRVDVLSTLGEVNLSLSRFARAEALFGQAQTLADASGDAVAARAVRVLHADTLQRAGRNADAIRELSVQLDVLRQAPSPILLHALGILAAAELATGATDSAIAHRREAAIAAERIHGAGSPEALAQAFDVGNTLAELQRFPEAVAVLDPLLARWRANRTPEDDRYVVALTSLATATDGIGDRPATEAHYRELLDLKRRIYTAPHDAIAKGLRDLAGIVLRSEKFGEAESLLNAALTMQRQVFGDNHAELATTYETLGEVMIAQRRFVDADADYRAAIAICERAQIREEICPHARNDLGMSLYRQGRLDEAKQEMTLALAERRALLGNDHPTVAFSLSALANVAAKQNKPAEAVRLSAEALAVLERSGRGASREDALIRNGYAQALWLANRGEDALREIDRTLVDWQRVSPDGKTRHVTMLVQKAQILSDLKRPDDARRTAEQAIAVGADPADLAPTTKDLLRKLSGRPDAYPAATDTSK